MLTSKRGDVGVLRGAKAAAVPCRHVALWTEAAIQIGPLRFPGPELLLCVEMACLWFYKLFANSPCGNVPGRPKAVLLTNFWSASWRSVAVQQCAVTHTDAHIYIYVHQEWSIVCQYFFCKCLCIHIGYLIVIAFPAFFGAWVRLEVFNLRKEMTKMKHD